MSELWAIAYGQKSSNINLNSNFRFLLPVWSVLKNQLPVLADITKMCKIEFRMESFETFCLWKVFYYVKHADLEVIGPLGPLRSVTVNKSLNKPQIEAV